METRYCETSFKVKGYYNRWSVMDIYNEYALLENETYGDETCYLLVNRNAPIEYKQYTKKDGTKVMLPTIMEVICETYDDIITTLETEDLL